NNGITNAVATVIVTPSLNGCEGPSQSFTITVNPTVGVDDPTDQTVCNNAAVSAISFSGAVSGTSYSWTNDNISIGLADSGSGDIASFTANNSTSAPVVANITVTPSANGCEGPSQSFTITVNPTPSVDDPADQIVCNNAAVSAISFSGAVSGTSYSWINDNPAIGLAASGSGDIASFTASNSTSAPVV